MLLNMSRKETEGEGGNHFEGFVEEVDEYYFEDEDGVVVGVRCGLVLAGGVRESLWEECR